jgi:hypothetical protein
MERTVWVALTDDWELRGNGLGSVEELKMKTARRLMDCYESLGLRSTFNLEVLQQLAHEREASENADIRRARDLWLDTVEEMIERGFDIQLHLHPQWHDANHDGDYWRLAERWNITDYEDDLIEETFHRSLDYLDDHFPKEDIESFRA